MNNRLISMLKNNEDLLEAVRCHFGNEKQKLKTVEELNELGAALIRDNLGLENNVEEEFADVLIMLWQIYSAVDKEKLEYWLYTKINKLDSLID